MMNQNQAAPLAVVLVSGGLDSMISAASAREQGYRVLALSVDYNQRHRVELAAARRVANVLGAERHIILPLETLVWRLFNEEEDVRVLASTPLSRGCRCTGDYIASVLSKFSIEERREMADDSGFIQVDCAFCATKFPVPAEADPVA
jgi:redox-regulated HSP33 family molecular chaperone